MENYIIKQISVFSENRPGRLAAIAQALQDEDINILAFSIAEADGFGVVRALVDKPRNAYDTLGNLGFNVAFTDVIAVKMRDHPGGLYEIARILGEGKINIEYSYAYSGKEGAVLILRVDNIQSAIKVILEGGGSLMETSAFQ
ncbi:MAG TPA: ACT domain-containing protein [Methanoregulaceae archaeon]|nr:ACT domain-containing protein [Methanoregulaceae archaeon]